MILLILNIYIGLAKKMLNDNEPAHSDAVLMALAQYFPPELNYWERKGEYDGILILSDCFFNFSIYH